MITNVVQSVLNVFMSMLEVALTAVMAVIAPVLIMCLFVFLGYLFRGYRLPKRTVKITNRKYSIKINPVKLLLWDFPNRVVKDLFTRNPDSFDTFGVHIFCGEQGSGKSIAAVHFAKTISERNPMSELASNIDLNFQNNRITSWRDILTLNNGEYGQIVFLDEIQNWFSSNESKNFPPEMLTEITQQRKQRKIVIGTSQVFGRVSKPIREQITLLYKPVTLFGCLTVVRVYKVDLNDDGTVKKMHMRDWYAFVHDDELRNAYDTYEKVQRLSVTGFQPRSEQLEAPAVPNNTNIRIISDRKK